MKPTFDEYQLISFGTSAYYEDRVFALAIFGLGLTGEAGEVSEIIKKQVGHGHPGDKDKVAKELGDVLWYVAAIATEYGLSLGDIARLNIEKLRARYPEGFSTQASLARVDETVASERAPQDGKEDY